MIRSFSMLRRRRSFRMGSATTSTGRCRIAANRRLRASSRPKYANPPRAASVVSRTTMSISESLRCSPRAADPNTARPLTPAARSSGSCARSLAMISSRSIRRYYAPERARSMNSGRSALLQSGMAWIFLFFSRISACCCMYGLRSPGKPGFTSTRESAVAKVCGDIL
jgi:hypothetical protein